MAYTRATVGYYLNRVRRYTDHSPFVDEDVSTESAAEESASTSIPDDFIIQSINAAMEAIVGRAKACHVYEQIQLDLDTTTPTSEVVRVLYGSAKRNGNRAVYREARRARRLESTKQAGTDEYPVFTYDGGEVIFYPSANYGGGDTSEFRYVTRPTSVTSESDLMPLDERFGAAVVYYAAAECFARLQEVNREDIARQHFEDEMGALSLGTRTSRVDNREVASE
jgi:hypothetical protein